MKKILLSLALALPLWVSAQVADPEVTTTYTMLARTGWTATASSEELVGETAPNGPIAAVLDGSTSTFWHSKWNGGADPLPHTLVFNMQGLKNIDGFMLQNRQNNGNTDIKAVEILTSPDNIMFTSQVTATNLGHTNSQQYFDFPATVNGVQYVKVIISDAYSGTFASLSEAGAYTKAVNTDIYTWNRSAWVITASDSYASQPTSNLNDKNNGTWWEANWALGAGHFPRWVQFDLGALRDVNQLSYVQRNHVNSRIKNAAISVSADNITWETVFPTFTWIQNSNQNYLNIGSTKNIRYIKLDIQDSQGDASSVALAEFRAHFNLVLPVELSAFTAKTKGNSVGLSWTTASEKNASHYLVTRSTDGKNFSSIARVEAAGNSNAAKTYSYTDNTPFAGTNYYQLQQVDLNGDTHASKVVNAKVALTGTTLIVKSVSASSVTLAVAGANAGKGQVIASNALGQVIASQSVDFANGNTATINTGAAKGLIIFTLSTANGTISKKIVK
jgi:hypothetical protein